MNTNNHEMEIIDRADRNQIQRIGVAKFARIADMVSYRSIPDTFFHKIYGQIIPKRVTEG